MAKVLFYPAYSYQRLFQLDIPTIFCLITINNSKQSVAIFFILNSMKINVFFHIMLRTDTV